ncbi:hypothetical protein CSB45_14590 [candidate division KSB3 bacterium]|uniref:Roadblock/LAMTOR2 domain-containing protein n=1 Tax=candidate division KSB3 bacterium TaxID=2044937 RepID=A0A2G6E147_9BACT|nr:MAG: hypothetical protein CSB45_14590 [candidate division KSB3 bacterium]PIE28429.1 MAG: hypothetical protein CSA57_14030 [candidate division KSB3 bacterium]
MPRINLGPLEEIEGFQAGSLVDVNSGLVLASVGSGIDIELFSAEAAEVYKKVNIAEELGLDEEAEDILMTFSSSYYLIRPLQGHKSEYFIFIDLEREKANLAMARHDLKKFEESLNFS